MNKKMTALVLTAALGMFAAFSSRADGDIYDISPCDAEGVDLSGPLADYDNPLDSGSNVYFKVRLVAKTGGGRWGLSYDNSLGIMSEEVAKLLFPMQIGIYVSGERTYATLHAVVPEGTYTTAFVFSYTTKPGDFALPIRLATEDGPAEAGSGGDYVFDPSRSYWKVTSTMADSSEVECTWLFVSSETERILLGLKDKRSTITPAANLNTDITLERCGFYVKTVDFSDDWQSESFWRFIHENSTDTSNDVPPRLSIRAPSEMQRTFYVWSEDETIVQVDTSNTVEMQIDSVGNKKTFHVGTVTFPGQKSDPVPFPLRAMPGSEGKEAKIVMSAYPRYTFSAVTQDDLIECVKVPVKCVGPRPPTLVVERDSDIDARDFTITAKVGAGYLEPVATLRVYLTQPYDTDLVVSVTNAFSEAGFDGNWRDYVCYSTDGAYPVGAEDAVPSVTIPAGYNGKATSQKIYVFAKNSDEHVGTLGHWIMFFPSVDQSVVDEGKIENYAASRAYIDAEDLEIAEHAASATGKISGTCNIPIPFNVKVSDIFAASTNRNAGAAYRVQWKKNETETTWTDLPGLYYLGAQGRLYEIEIVTSGGTTTTNFTSKVPTLTYTTSNNDPGFTSALRVVSPAGAGDERAAEISFTAIIEEPKGVALMTYDPEEPGVEKTRFDESSEKYVDLTIKLSVPNDTGSSVYAYLVPQNAVDITKLDADFPFVVGMTNEVGGTWTKLQGIEIPINQDTATASLFFLDGTRTGQKFMFKVVISDEREWDGIDDSKLRSDYGSQLYTVTVLNVEPSIVNGGRIEMNGEGSEGDGARYKTRLPVGSSRNFNAIVVDPGEYDLVNTNGNRDLEHDPGDLFRARWSVYLDEELYSGPHEVRGDPQKFAFTNLFDQAGIWRIECQFRDKDMRDWSKEKYSVEVEVIDNPMVTINDDDPRTPTSITYYENDTTPRLKVGLSDFDNRFSGTAYVAVKVARSTGKAYNLGILNYSPDYKWTDQGPEGAPFEIGPGGVRVAADTTKADYYLVPLSKSVKSRQIDIVALDGTDVDYKITAYVAFTLENDGTTYDKPLPTSNQKAAEYYLPKNADAFVENLAPVCTATEPDTNRVEVVGSVKISWSVKRDADNDYVGVWDDGIHRGIRVMFEGDINNPETNSTIYVTNRYVGASGTFVPDFGERQGPVKVRLTIEDKDGGSEEWTYLYTVPVAKLLRTYAAGPLASQSQYADGVKGLGEGHVHVADVSFQKAESFMMTWNCGKSAEATARAFGYKYSGDESAPMLDNGTLDGGYDVGIGADGSRAGTATPAAWYPYKPNGGLDSFLYLWVDVTPDESGNPVDTPIGNFMIEVPGKTHPPRPIALPTEQTEDGAYRTKHVEAIFSREFAAEDNLGDINQDGIPDYLALSWRWREGRFVETLFGDAFENHWRALDDANTDNDFLPGVWQESRYGHALSNKGLASYSPYVANAMPFKAFYEIRGFGGGLNYVENGRIISKPSLSKEEQAAYKAAFLAENGTEWTDADGFDLSFWNPRPGLVDPTTDDTDDDGKPDGWEYFFWYQAKVWAPAGSGIGKPQEGQKFVFERFNLADILHGTEIPAEEVLRRFNPCVDDMIGADDYNPDFDGDGLADIEELLIGTNPCHWDTDGDLMCDGWEVLNALNPLGRCKTNNSDGDFMAFCFLEEYWGWQDPATSDYVFDVSGEISFSDYEIVSPGVIQLVRDVTLTGALVATPRVDGNGDPYCYGLPLAEEVTKGSNIKFWHWGYPMLDNLQPQSEVTLQAGEYLYNTDYVLVHDQVATAFGFDPRTGWNKDAHGYVASRWDPAVNTALSGQDITGLAVNTEPYCDYDEYLALRYRRDYGVYLAGDADWKPDDVWGMMQGYTTAPSVIFAKADLDAMLSGTNSTVNAEAATNLYATASVSEALANAFAEAGSDKANRHGHGADTDGDGIPDGWELYMSRCPNSGEFDIPEDYDFDGLETPAEFAGTDSCNAYIGCESIYRQHTGNASGWFNKFFPTNPYSRDTDGDGLSDADEGSAWKAAVPYGGGSYALDLSFIYGNPQDSITCCVRGGGLNPCTVDTDIDGLPDLWEMQYAGIPTDAGARKYVPPAGGDDADVAYRPSTWIADGIYDGFAGSNVVYIVGGMDGTWGGDGWTDTVNNGNSYDGRIGAIRDVDFDHDGLQNFQEYLVQQVRHFRYDDITTPLMGRYIDEGEYDLLTPAADLKSGHAFHDAKAFVPMMQDADRFSAAAIVSWGDAGSVSIVTNVTGYTVTTNEYSGVVYTNETYEIVSKVMPGGGVVANKHFGTGYNYMYSTPWSASGWRANGYMAMPTHGWDRLIACALGYPYIMMPPAGAYVSTDPRIADTDSDGMDDYYEMFHGLNPLLGSTAAGASDVIALAWGQPTYFNAFWNEWTTRDAANKSDFNRYRALLGRPGSAVPALQDASALDPIRYPWAMGANEADPDGDGLRNDAERVTANLTSPMTAHTDPTPLWFTDSGSPNSYVNQYYANTYPVTLMPFWPLSPVFNDPYSQPAVYGGYNGPAYLYAFEENEGYDTDNDWVADGREIVRTFRAPTDPLDFTDPARRQALYLDGNGSWVQTTASSLRPVDAVDMYKQFTVEAWVWPEETSGARVIVDRSAEYGYDAITKDAGAIRSNFRIGITAEGRVYGMFDNDDSIVSGYQEGVSCQTVVGSELPLEEWSHVALTYDGKRLVLYVNGAENASAPTHLIPANGVSGVMQDPAYTNTFEAVAYRALPCAFFIGGRPAAFAEDGADALEIATASAAVMNQNEWFKGFVDEVRVWDGARTAAEISAGYRRHMTMDDAATNRLEVYTHLMGPEADSSRNDNDGLEDLTAELVQLYDFSTLPGAAESDWTAKTPAGFESAVVGQLVGKTDVFDPAVSWWSTSPGRSTVYSDYRVVPWIENTVRHLPTMDGSVIDSFLYSDSLGGYYTTAGEHGLGKFTLYNSAMPYHYYQYYLDRYQRLFCLNRAHEAKPDDTTVRDALYRYRYEIRSYFTATGDLVPMGGAYAKTCPEMWDGNGVADAWSQTGTDTDGDGLPDKWEENNGLDPNSADDWAAMVSYNGTDIPAWEAYLRDLAKGWQPDGSFKDAYKSTADADANGLLDWWQNLYALTTGASGDDDGDGLSNYVEYMLSEIIFGPTGTGNWLRFAPDNAKSVNPAVSDYFYRLRDLYVGEVFTDNDQIKDQWESTFLVKSNRVSPYLYDADVDADGDGWSNYAEFQAGSRPTVLASLGIDGVQIEEYPIPTIEMTIAYHGNQGISDKPIVVKAWSDPSLATRPDAIWTLGGSSDVSVTQNGGSNVVTGVRYIGMNPQREMLMHLSPGSVVPGSVSFEFKDLAWVLVNMLTQQGYVFDAATAIWEGALIDSQHTGETTGDIIDQGTKDVLGTIDYITGAVTIDFTKLRERLYIDGDISGSSGEGDWVSIYDLSSSYVRVNWQSKLITGGTTATYYLGRADDPSGANNSLGHVKQGANTFIAFYDLNADGMYTPGEPYGFARNVDVGWNYAKLSVELTDTSVVTPRYSLTGGGEGSGGASGTAAGDAAGGAATDREQLWELSSTDVMVVENGGSLTVPAKDHVRVRIARFAIDSLNSCLPANDMAIVYDQVMDLTEDGHPSITEAEILSDVRNQFDIDWAANADGSSQRTLSQVYDTYRNVSGIAFTNMIYAVYFGEGPIYAKVDTNEHMLCRMLVRKFDTVRHGPVPVAIPGTLTSPAPTFTWKDSPVDTTYTAFRIRIKNESGAVVWTSEYQLLPPRDEKNVYSWTPPVRVGATVPGGTAELKNHAHYSWEISTYNAKYTGDLWTSGGDFYTDVPSGGLDYGTARVAVRYYGPSSVAAGRVRVQAFTTPDFSGDPVAEGYVNPGDDSLSSTAEIKAANATILGLKSGTYYIRAFIDTDGNGRLSTDTTVTDGCVWESWGCFCTRNSRTGTIFTPKSVTVGPGSGVGDIIPVFIEDCDVDNDCLPDAWEWINGNHSLATMSSRSIDKNAGGFAMNSTLAGELEESEETGPGLAVSFAMRSLSTSRVAALLLGVDATGSDDAVGRALNSAGSDATAEPVSVSITAIELDRDSGTVKITTDSKGMMKGSDVIVSEIYTIPSGAESLTLTCKVLHCDVLGGPWTEIESKEVKIDRTTTDYTFDLGENVDLSSGFFKAKLEK